MPFWDSVRAFFKSEAADVREGFENLKDKLETELTRRETELAATPSERLDMIHDDIDSRGSVFDDIEAKLDERLGVAKGESEVAELNDSESEDDGDSLE